MSDKVKTMGSRIKKLREDLGITQDTLARRLNVTPQHISAIELDKRLPSLSFLAQLAEQFKTTTDYIITGKSSGQHDAVAAVLSDDALPDEAKKALASLINLFRNTSFSTNQG